MAYDGELVFDTRMDASGFQKGCNTLGSIVKGLGIFEVLKSGFQMVQDSMDAAISRYDTLNKFPLVMEQMGYGADTAQKSISKLSNGIQGLPTTLNDIVGNTQRLSIATGSLETGTDLALALNNAFLSSGASSESAARGTEQFIQALSRGKVEGEEWKTLQESMPYALQKTAEAFGFAGTSAQSDFYEALKDGEITLSQVSEKLIELNEQTGGFAEVAKTATGGIGTAMTNLKNRTVIGVTAIVEAFDRGLSKTRFKSIETVINSVSTTIKNALKGAAKSVEFFASELDVLLPIVVGVTAAFKTYSIINTATAAFKKMNTAVAAASAILKASTLNAGKDVAMQTALAAALKNAATAEAVKASAKKAGMTIDAAGNLITAQGTAATAAETASVLASSGALSAKQLVVGVLTGKIGIATAAQYAWNAAMSANSIGLVIAAVVAAVAVFASLVAITNKLSDSYQEHKKKTEELCSAQEQLSSSVESTKATYEDFQNTMQVQSQRSDQLISSLKDQVSAAEESEDGYKNLMATINELNSTYEGLNLSYDEETKSLSASTEAVEEYINAKMELDTVNETEERQIELKKQQIDLDNQRKAISEEILQINEDLNSGKLTTFQAGKMAKDLKASLDELNTQYDDVTAEITENNGILEDSNKELAQATVNEFEAMSGAKTTDGKNLKQLAKQYGISTDEILKETREQGVSMQDWYDKKSALYTKEGYDIQQIADKWGMTKDEVQRYMDEWGMNLNEFSQEMEATHTKDGFTIEQLAVKWGTTVDAIEAEMLQNNMDLQAWSDNQDSILEEWNQAVQENKELVINGMRELPTEMDYTLDEMIAIMNENAEKYNAWRAKMVEVSSQLTPEVLSYIEQLGPGTSEILDEIISDTSGTKAQQLNSAFANVGSSAVLGMESTYPELEGAGQTAVENMARGVTDSTAAPDAMNDKIDSVKKVTETGIKDADFTGSGEKIVAGLTKGINSKASGAKQATINVVGKVKEGFQTLPKYASAVAENMMNAMLYTMDNQKWALYNKANEIAQNIISTLKGAFQIHSPSRVMVGIFTNLMKGGSVGLDKNSASLYKQVEAIADGVSDRFTAIPESFAQMATEKLQFAVDATQAAVASQIPSVVLADRHAESTETATAARQGDTFIFNDPVETPAAHARAVKQAVREALYGI